VVFLGDSTTYGLLYYKILPGERQTPHVWVPENGTLTLHNVPQAEVYLADEDRSMALTEALAHKKPKILIVTLGVNGVSWMTESSFKQEYREIVDAVREHSPDTLVIPQTIFPIRPEYKHQDSINNVKIARANLWIAELARECGLPYLNTAEILLNEHGYLKKGYDSGDGMHLMPDVYRKIVDYVLEHPVNIITDPSAPGLEE